MDGFIGSIERALSAEIWQPALALSLSVPDILGQIEYPELSGRGKTGARYEQWFDTWVVPALYSGQWAHFAGIMNGQDCYAFRCSYLHVGESLLDEPHKSQWQRIVPTPGDLYHFGHEELLGVKTSLCVGVTPFCSAVCEAARSWRTAILSRRPEAQGDLDRLLFIESGVARYSHSVEVNGLRLTVEHEIRP